MLAALAERPAGVSFFHMTNTEQEVKRVLRDTLQLGSRVDAFTRSTRLLGALPELDSMAVVSVIAGLEETFGFSVADDEISAETFATFDSLCVFVDQKLRS
jgi:acyl carrier protein